METELHSTGPLHGVRIWLAGAVPSDATEAQKASVVTFVREFAKAVFRNGGHILHGSHPSLVGPLIEQAKEHVSKGGRKDCLTLAVSKYWSKDQARVPVQEWRQTCTVNETAEVTGCASPRDDSLKILRQWMTERCDAFVAVGGQWWQEIAGRAGIPIEAGLAMQRGLPCFLLGGLGGVAGDYVRNHPEVLRSLKNGLDDTTNQRLALEENVGSIVGVVSDQLSRLPLVRGRVSDGISFRILALDGGGVKGAFTASVLTTLEHALGVPVASQFDLVAGTSTGGIRCACCDSTSRDRRRRVAGVFRRESLPGVKRYTPQLVVGDRVHASVIHKSSPRPGNPSARSKISCVNVIRDVKVRDRSEVVTAIRR